MGKECAKALVAPHSQRSEGPLNLFSPSRLQIKRETLSSGLGRMIPEGIGRGQ